ncbi:MAG: helix-turn-helix transcriptional regulator [Thermoleophilaceae bacterium]
MSAENQKRFGANVRRRRHEVGISQEDLAYEAGMHFTAISKLERGEREPRLHTILSVAAALEVPPAHLLDGLEPPKRGARGSSAIRT